eukprot:scaffold13938_cov109-Isochrysis_galbana.AAC.4
MRRRDDSSCCSSPFSPRSPPLSTRATDCAAAMERARREADRCSPRCRGPAIAVVVKSAAAAT